MANMMDTSMDPVRQLIRNTLSERHLNMSNVSKRLGKNHAYLHQFLDRGIPAQLPELVREKLAVILQVPEAQLKGGASQGRGSATARVVREPTLVTGDRIPVRGAGQGGSEGWFPWNGEIVDYVSRPPNLAGATHAYAVYVVGSSMEPRYYAGEIVHIHPGKPVTNGAFVLVQVRPEAEGETPRAFMKRLVRRTATKVTLEQFNPPKEIDIKASDIASMHRIVGSAETGGL
jgi:phage repressor protein C with HTH and peptisase S24 domain